MAPCICYDIQELVRLQALEHIDEYDKLMPGKIISIITIKAPGKSVF